MIEWYCSISLAVISVLALFVPYKPLEIRLLMTLFIVSFVNELTNYVLAEKLNVLNNIQFLIDFILVGSVTAVVYLGFFRYIYLGVFLFLQALFFALMNFAILPLLFGQQNPEVSLAITEIAFILLVLLTMTFRVSKLYKDYRFWVLAGLFSYYALALQAFIYPSQWWLNSVALVIACLLILTGFYFGLFTHKFNTLSEQFLIPRWLQERIQFLDVPRVGQASSYTRR